MIRRLYDRCQFLGLTHAERTRRRADGDARWVDWLGLRSWIGFVAARGAISSSKCNTKRTKAPTPGG